MVLVAAKENYQLYLNKYLMILIFLLIINIVLITARLTNVIWFIH